MRQSGLPLIALIAGAYVGTSTAAPQVMAYDRSGNNVPCPWQGVKPLTHDELLSNYFTLWAGNYDLLDDTVMPDVQVWQDRLPNGNTTSFLPIHNSSALLNFVKFSREAFYTYSFIDLFHYGVGDMITSRWQLDATVKGSAYNVPNGTHVAYNGTLIMIQDHCTGKLQQDISAQDLLNFFHELNVPSIAP